ncbi:MAG: toprim domain-containing protein [Sulfuriferula sp.]
MAATLVLAVRNVDGDIKSLQFIDEDGSKRLMKGGEKRGHWIHINGSRTASRILICEGWATGATLAEAFPDDCVIAAIDAGNLLPVAQAIRASYPDAAITICADDDHLTPGNPGRTKATAAALAVGAKLAIPDFGNDWPDHATDFNDLANLMKARRHFDDLAVQMEVRRHG